MKNKNYTISLNEWESLLIAQFFKRTTFDAVRECAVDNDETYQMIAVIENVRKQLGEQGMSPR
jgi:hypothetical protein